MVVEYRKSLHLMVYYGQVSNIQNLLKIVKTVFHVACEVCFIWNNPVWEGSPLKFLDPHPNAAQKLISWLQSVLYKIFHTQCVSSMKHPLKITSNNCIAWLGGDDVSIDIFSPRSDQMYVCVSWLPVNFSVLIAINTWRKLYYEFLFCFWLIIQFNAGKWCRIDQLDERRMLSFRQKFFRLT